MVKKYVKIKKETNTHSTHWMNSFWIDKRNKIECYPKQQVQEKHKYRR